MISSNTRATRSRFSSPARPPNGNTNGSADQQKGNVSQASRAFMQRWLEPSVQAKASFEDDGLVRHGVVENMAPLGVLPKNKKPGSDTGSSVRKIILRPSGGNAANSASEPAADAEADADAPASASPPPPPTVAPTPPRRRSIAVKVAADDDDDEDYDPKIPPKRRQSARMSVGKRGRRSSGARRSSISAVTKPTTPKETRSSKEAREAREKESPLADPEVKEFTDKVIDSAVDEALKHYRYPTAWALRTLYDENSHKQSFLTMIEDVFSQTADAPTLRRFSKQIEKKKREGKKDNRGCYYFFPPTTNNRFTPRKPKAAPYESLLQQDQEEDDEPEEPQSEDRASKRAKTSHSTHTHTHATRDTPRKMASGVSTSTSTSGHGITGEPRTPTRERNRRDSASSDSSLSSVMSLSSPEVSIAAASPVRRANTRPGPDSSDAPKSRPITTRRKSLASKSKQPRSSPSTSNSPTHPISSNISAADASARASMPGRVSAEQLFPNLPKKQSKAAKGSSKAPMSTDDAPSGDQDSFWDRRRDARRFANSLTAEESCVRGASEEQVVTPVRKTRKTRHSIAVPPTTRSTRSASKRPHDELEMTVSPVALSFQDGSSTVGSRAATPSLRPAKKQRSGLRVKSSPVKKRGGTAAGLPRPTGDPSAAANAPKDQASDNDEDCSACGAAGDVVCCDGCPRSFHFECVGMVQSDSLPDEWYCNECVFRRFPSRMPAYKGVFASALHNLEKSIPRAFSLPKQLQTRFEGVKAGTDGDYEEATTAKTAKKKNGYEEVADFFKQREDGQAVLCHGCQTPATDVRAIVSCSVCPLHWHLDCLDPPLTIPPVPKTWRCPVHVDDVLTEMPPMGPAHRFRKIKGAQTIAPALSRGIKNNGHIEVDWADEPEPSNKSGWPDPDSFGRPYKLGAKGIVLDFIEQLRRQGAGYGPRHNEPRWMSYVPTPLDDPHRPIRGSDMQRTVDEMQVSLALNSLKLRRSDNVDDLVSALLNSADPAVLALMAKNNAENLATGHLTEVDKLGLRAVLAQMDAMSARIRELLGEAPPSAVTAAALLDHETDVPSILSPEDSAIVEPTEKLDAAPVTEPTPPSTIDHAEGTMEID